MENRITFFDNPFLIFAFFASKNNIVEVKVLISIYRYIGCDCLCAANI